MRGYSRRLVALVLAVTVGGAAWGVSIDYVTGNDQGASYLGGKTISISYTGASFTVLADHVYLQGSQVISLTSRFGGSCSVVVNDSGTFGTIDIEVPPRPALWDADEDEDIWLDTTGAPPPESDRLDFTYWNPPVLTLQGGQLLGDMQQAEVGGEIQIAGTDLPDADPGNPSVPLYGRTVAVEFGPGTGNFASTVKVFTGYVLVTVPSGTIGDSVQLVVTVDDGGWDEMEAVDRPNFTWCPGRPNPPPSGIAPFEGPLAGNIDPTYVSRQDGLSALWYDVYDASGTDPVYITLSGGANFYYGYTYVSFDDFDGPWVVPAAGMFNGTTELQCPLLPQPDRLELQPVIYVMNAYIDSEGRLRKIGRNSTTLAFYYKDQVPQQVSVTGLSDGAVVDGSILLQAEAVDDRAIVQVAFYYSTAGTAPDPQTEWLNPGSYTLLGTDTTWPYEFLWDTDSGTFPDDDYHIIAVAVDDHVWTTIVPQLGNYPDQEEIYNATGGNIVASNAVTVTVDNAGIGTVDNPPQAQMSVPADGAVFSVDGGSITLSALVADYEGLLNAANTVQFLVADGNGRTWSGSLGLSWLTYLYTDPVTTLDWYFATVTWDGMVWDVGLGAFVKAADGTHRITVEVWDDHPGGAGTTPQSATDGVTITVDSSAVSITSITPDGSEPLVGSDLAGADALTHDPLIVTITGDGFVDGGTTVLFAGVPATNMTWDSATLLIVEVPNLGLPLSAADAPIDVSVTVGAVTQTLSNAFYVEDSEPTSVFLGPQAGATVGGTVLLQADARDDSAIASVTYQYSLTGGAGTWNTIDTVYAATDNYPFSYAYDTSDLADGTWFFQALATDDGGNVLTDVDVTSVAFALNQSGPYDNPPRVTITLPARGAIVSGTSVVLEATVTDDPAATIVAAEFEIISSGRSETLSVPPIAASSIVLVDATNGVWTVSATWVTTELVGTIPAYPDGLFYLIRAAATDDATPSSNTGYDAVNVTVQNGAPVIPPYTGGGGGGGGGCSPSDTAAPAASLLLLGTVFLVFRRRRAAPA